MTDKELYENLIDRGYEEQDINQILKAKEEGYNIYNIDIKITTEQIRNFRTFLKNNTETGLEHGQLREILLGWMKNLNVLEYSDKKYSKEEMALIRKALENKKDINLLKKYGTDAKSMLEISRAMGFGCDENDFKKYTIEQLKLFNDYQKKKIDIRRLLDKGFNKEQINYLLQFEKKHKDFVSYFNKDYHYTMILHFGNFLDKYSYEQLKPLFHPRTSLRFLDIFTELIDKKIPGWEIYADPEKLEKSNLIASFFKYLEPHELIENIHNSNLKHYEYEKINMLYLKKNCPKEQIESICIAAKLGINIENLLVENLNPQIYPIILKVEKFNQENERKIDVTQLLSVNISPEKLENITKKLMSSSLDDNILGYSQISNTSMDIKKKNIER